MKLNSALKNPNIVWLSDYLKDKDYDFFHVSDLSVSLSKQGNLLIDTSLECLYSVSCDENEELLYFGDIGEEINIKKIDYCNTCNEKLGTKECSYPSSKNMYFLGDKKKNSICCEECQIEAGA